MFSYYIRVNEGSKNTPYYQNPGQTPSQNTLTAVVTSKLVILLARELVKVNEFVEAFTGREQVFYFFYFFFS